MTRGSRMKRRIEHGVSLLQVIMLAAVGGFACAHRLQAQESQEPIEVQDCAVRFAKEVDVPALETGRVAEVYVQPNVTIKLGEPIARLDDTNLLKRRQAEGLRLDTAKAESVNDIEVRYARTALKEANAELELNRKIDKEHGGSVQRQRLQQLSLAAERAKLEVDQAQTRLKRAAVQVQLQENEVAVLDDQLRNLHSDSPIAGIVLNVHKSAGEWITKGEPLATVAQIDRLHVHALMSSRQISPASCRDLQVSVFWKDPVTNVNRTLRGKVLSVDPQVLPGQRFRLHAEIINRPNPKNSEHWQLNPGAEIRMFVHTSTRTASLNFEPPWR